MSDIRNRLANWRQGMHLLGFNPENVNWQSIAVLLANLPEKSEDIRACLLDARGGWTTKGVSRESEGTSLYLSPKGMCYWLRHGGHYALYHGLMHIPQSNLDRAGWLHISGGRVDVYCRLTSAQERWLAENECILGDTVSQWRIYDAVEMTNRDYTWRSHAAPRPCAAAEAYDIRPVPDDDWDRLESRISLAKETARHARLAG